MTEAVTMPSVMMMTSRVFEESLARDPHTHTQTDRETDTFSKVVIDCMNKKINWSFGVFNLWHTDNKK